MAFHGFLTLLSQLLFLHGVVVVLITMRANAQPAVPAMFMFGDSAADVGNNNYLPTIVKANFPPYGRDFPQHKPTGRFCNGKLATDLTAQTIGFTSFQPAYLSEEASGKNLLIGANFASGSSGYHEVTAFLYHAIPLSRQLQYYSEYQEKLKTVAGANSSTIISRGIYLVSAGSSDFLQNYYINPLFNKFYTAAQFSDILLTKYSDFIKKLYGLGARKIGVTSLPPLGCLPAAITIFGQGSNECVEHINKDAMEFNSKLNSTSQQLTKELANLTIVVFDIYQPLHDLVMKPGDRGFVEARRACCGTGLIETSFLCNANSPGTCKNATEYIFWDGFHPTEAANNILSSDLIASGIPLITGS